MDNAAKIFYLRVILYNKRDLYKFLFLLTNNFLPSFMFLNTNQYPIKT